MSLSTEKKQKRPKRKRKTTYEKKYRKKEPRFKINDKGVITSDVNIYGAPFSFEVLDNNLARDRTASISPLEQKRAEIEQQMNDRYLELSSDTRETKINPSDSTETKMRKRKNKDLLDRERHLRERKKREKKQKELEDIEEMKHQLNEVKYDTKVIQGRRRRNVANLRRYGPSFSEIQSGAVTGHPPFGIPALHASWLEYANSEPSFRTIQNEHRHLRENRPDLHNPKKRYIGNIDQEEMADWAAYRKRQQRRK